MAGVKTGISGQINNNIVTDGLILYIDPGYKLVLRLVQVLLRLLTL